MATFQVLASLLFPVSALLEFLFSLAFAVLARKDIMAHEYFVILCSV